MINCCYLNREYCQTVSCFEIYRFTIEVFTIYGINRTIQIRCDVHNTRRFKVYIRTLLVTKFDIDHLVDLLIIDVYLIYRTLQPRVRFHDIFDIMIELSKMITNQQFIIHISVLLVDNNSINNFE